MLNKKLQSSVEFVILISFMLAVFMLFFVIAASKVMDMKEEKNRKTAENFMSLVENEITLAASLRDGYSRELSLPPTIEGDNYTIALLGNRELVLNYTSYEYVVFLPSNVIGNISQGLNLIEKIEGIVYINHIPTCGDLWCEGTEDCITCPTDCACSPTGTNCEVKDFSNCLGTVVFKLSDTQDAHAALYDKGNFQYGVCCTDSGTLDTVCTGSNEILHLSAKTDAHAEDVNKNNFNVDVCLSKDGSAVTCNINTGACPANKECLATLSSEEDAHVGNCSFTDIRLCCSV